MIKDFYLAAKTFGDSIFLLDRYFLSVPALQKLQELTSKSSAHMEIITKAKANCTAYEKSSPRKPRRGRPPKRGGTAIHLEYLFESHKERFRETEMVLYGKKENMRYYNIDLLWRQKLYQELRFVLVEYNGTQSVLTVTYLRSDPLSMIRLYSFRFRTEYIFRELKRQTETFCYHFWSKQITLS